MNKNIKPREEKSSLAISIVDSGICNLESVIRAFNRLGTQVNVANKPQKVLESSALVLPGVGAYADGMESLRRKNLVDAIKIFASQGKPLLGICLGMQLLVESSEEHGYNEGLGLLPGRVIKLKPNKTNDRVPNIGWCDVNPSRPGYLFPDSYESKAFYFVHSYYLDINAEHVAATISFGGNNIAAAIESREISGVQFHPEKSQDDGLDLLDNWVQRVNKFYL